jgi:hypothetical protein
MSAPIKDFYHSQTSAPTLAGTVGYLDALLYACLVTGYNSKSISTITVSNNVATVTTSTTHGYAQYDTVKIEGANESVFNGDFLVASIPATNQFTFALTTGLSSATGTITCKIAPLGWTREYTGTNKSVYRAPSDPECTRLYLRIDDTNAKYGIAQMYETMTTVDTGTGLLGTVYWHKSEASSTASRPWYLVGTSRCFWFGAYWQSSYPNACNWNFFGDYKRLWTGDSWNCCMAGSNTTSQGNSPGYQVEIGTMSTERF